MGIIRHCKEYLLKILSSYFFRKNKKAIKLINITKPKFLLILNRDELDKEILELIIPLEEYLKSKKIGLKKIILNSHNGPQDSLNIDDQEIRKLPKISNLGLKEAFLVDYKYLFYLGFKFNPELKYLISRFRSKYNLGFSSSEIESFMDILIKFELKKDISDFEYLLDRVSQCIKFLK